MAVVIRSRLGFVPAIALAPLEAQPRAPSDCVAILRLILLRCHSIFLYFRNQSFVSPPSRIAASKLEFSDVLCKERIGSIASMRFDLPDLFGWMTALKLFSLISSAVMLYIRKSWRRMELRGVRMDLVIMGSA